MTYLLNGQQMLRTKCFSQKEAKYVSLVLHSVCIKHFIFSVNSLFGFMCKTDKSVS